jgi:hypothetical protein
MVKQGEAETIVVWRLGEPWRRVALMAAIRRDGRFCAMMLGVSTVMLSTIHSRHSIIPRRMASEAP